MSYFFFSFSGSNHFGIGGFWSKKLADNGMIGMTFTNGSPLVAPTRSTKVSSTNNKKTGWIVLVSGAFEFYLELV